MMINLSIIIMENLYIMNTRETLLLKTLEFKAVNTGTNAGDFIDNLLAQNPEKADELTKNVCARIPLQLAKDMEYIGSLLDLNKREIVTLAINDFLDEFDAWPAAAE
jgi:hypothetical protein